MLMGVITFNIWRGVEPSKQKLADCKEVKGNRLKRQAENEQGKNPVEKTLSSALLRARKRKITQIPWYQCYTHQKLWQLLVRCSSTNQ